MNERLITLNDGTKLEVKVNFLTLYMIQKSGLGKLLTSKSGKGKAKLTDDENIEAAAKLIHIILRSNGMKVDEEEAMLLAPMDPEEIRMSLEKKLKNIKKKNRPNIIIPRKHRGSRNKLG